MAKEFLEDLKHEGVTDQAIRDLTYNQVAHWTEEDECSKSIYAVEIIER